MQSLTVKGIAIWSRQGGTLPGDDATWAKTIRADNESRALVHLNKNDREEILHRGIWGVCAYTGMWGDCSRETGEGFSREKRQGPTALGKLNLLLRHTRLVVGNKVTSWKAESGKRFLDSTSRDGAGRRQVS